MASGLFRSISLMARPIATRMKKPAAVRSACRGSAAESSGRRGSAGRGRCDPVVQIAQGVLKDQICRDALLQPDAGGCAHCSQLGEIKGVPGAVHHYVQHGGLDGRNARDEPGGPLLGTALPVEDVGTGHVVLAGAHQGQFYLVLDVLDVHGAPVGQASGQ
jgi:hypothetical protein